MKHISTLVVVLLGCSSFGVPQEDVHNVCVEPTDCVTGLCSDGICLSDESDLEIAIKVIPPSDPAERTLHSWTQQPFPLSGATIVRDVMLPNAVDVAGTVMWQEQRVPAQIIFTSPGLPGRPPERLVVDTLTEPTMVGELVADFIARVEAGAMYQVDVLPSAESMPDSETPWLRTLPPLRLVQLETPSAGGAAIWPVEIEYPSFDSECGPGGSNACALNGVVVDAEEMPQQGLQVRAIDIDTGRVVSSTALTDAEGAFRIVTSPDATDYLLRVSGGEDRELFPTVSIDPALLPAGEARIRVPQPETVTYKGLLEDESGEGIDAATLTFVSNDVFDESVMLLGSYRTTTSTVAGSFEVRLLAGTYEIVISPNAGENAVIADELRITPPMTGEPVVSGQRFVAPARARLGGTIRTANGEPFPGVQIDAITLGILDGDELPHAAIYNRSSEESSDDLAQFDLRLDIGVYDVFVKPNADTSYGWRVMPNYTVGSLATLANPFEIEPPVRVRGSVRTASGAVISDAEVTVLGRREGTERFVELGRTRADETGFYQVLVSPRLAQSSR